MDDERPTDAGRNDVRDVRRFRRWPDAEIAALATRQQGRVARAQLYALGLGRGAIDHALQRGRLIEEHRGVYAVGHSAPAPYGRQMAAVLAVGDRAVLSHHSAAELWELTPWRRPPAEVHVTVVGRDAGRRRPGIRAHRAARLHERELTTLHDIPVTSPARTLRDVLPDLQPREQERAFDRVLKARIMTRADAAETAGRAPAARAPPGWRSWPPPKNGSPRIRGQTTRSGCCG